MPVSTDEEWEGLCQAMGGPEWAKHEKFADSLSRWKNQEEMDGHIEEWTRQYVPQDVTEMLQVKGVPAFHSLSNRGLVEDPHLNEREFFLEWDHPEIGKRKYDGMLWKMSKTPGKLTRRAPLVGEHNQMVFGEMLGMSEDKINGLIEEKVIY